MCPETPPEVTPQPPAREVMSTSDVARALRRIAHEIVERNKGAQDVVLLGIPSRGVELAQRLGALITEIEGANVPVGSLDVTMYRDDLRRQPTRSPRETRIPSEGVDGRTVVLVDDVLFSGRTVRAALDALGDLVRHLAAREVGVDLLVGQAELDLVDGAARVYDPIVMGERGVDQYGEFLKNYKPHPW